MAILVSIVFAFIIAELDLVEKIFSISENIRILSSFIAGLFFTSVFTTAPAIVVLGKISQIEPVLLVALFGGMGAVIGDMAIFFVFRNHISGDIDNLLSRLKNDPFRAVTRNRNIRWLGVLIGALIIASPLPDELGIAMMGISRVKFKVFIPVSFLFNSLGIAIIGYAARLIV